MASSSPSTASDESVWVRLPGLFSWPEVCMLFSSEAGHDDDWRFSVKLEWSKDDNELLYAVSAAPSRSSAPGETASDAASE